MGVDCMTGVYLSGTDLSCMADMVTHLLRPRSLRHLCRCSRSCFASSPCPPRRYQRRSPLQACASGSPISVTMRTSLRKVDQQ